MIYKLFLFESCRFLLWKYWRKITRIKNCLNLEKQKYLPHYCSNKGLKGTVVNLLRPYLNYNEIIKKNNNDNNNNNNNNNDKNNNKNESNNNT